MYVCMCIYIYIYIYHASAQVRTDLLLDRAHQDLDLGGFTMVDYYYYYYYYYYD